MDDFGRSGVVRLSAFLNFVSEFKAEKEGEGSAATNFERRRLSAYLKFFRQI